MNDGCVCAGIRTGGDYRIENLPTGTYRVTAEIPGFQAATTNTIEIRPGENTTLEFVLRLGCRGELDPPLWVVYPFAETLAMVEVVAYVRIRSVGDRERVLVETSCWFIRQVVADVIDMIDPQGTSPEIGTLRLNAGGWERSLAPGDEVIMFLRRGTGSVYAEVETSRLAVHDGRVDRVPVDAPRMRDGDAVHTVLNAIRETVRRNLARP
jgi:Carboxypeptidase regulatory-like domain